MLLSSKMCKHRRCGTEPFDIGNPKWKTGSLNCNASRNRVVYVECYFHHVGLVNAVMEKWHSHFDVDAYIYIFIPVKDSANKIPNQE